MCSLELHPHFAYVGGIVTPYERKMAEFTAARNRHDGPAIERCLEELRNMEPPLSKLDSESVGNDNWVMEMLIDESGH